MKVKAKVVKGMGGFFVECDCCSHTISGPFDNRMEAKKDAKAFEREVAALKDQPPEE